MLRKGPEHVPASPTVLLFAIALLFFSLFCTTILIEDGEGDSLLSLITAVLGYVLYTTVLSVTGFLKRLLPTIASIMACGSILSVMMVAAFVFLNPFLGAQLASLVAWLILIWSVPVKGHIIARAIERHWYIGIAVSLTIFVLQYYFQSAMTGRI